MEKLCLPSWGASLLNPPSPPLPQSRLQLFFCLQLFPSPSFSCSLVRPTSLHPLTFPLSLSGRFGRRESARREEFHRVREATPLRSLRPVWRKGRTRDERHSLSRGIKKRGWLPPSSERREILGILHRKEKSLLVLREFSKTIT